MWRMPARTLRNRTAVGTPVDRGCPAAGMSVGGPRLLFLGQGGVEMEDEEFALFDPILLGDDAFE